MNLKISHKMTLDSPDYLAVDMNRSNRKNKTMLRSFHGKQGSPFDIQLSQKDDKQIKTILETKIQQLHSKMKGFFSQERKSHLEEIAPEMSELKKSIEQLKQQLCRPKSMAQIEQQKHSLLKRKVFLLKQIEHINKKLKENKHTFYQLKFQSQQLDRQLLNGYRTIEKYKGKLSQIKQKQSFKSQNQNQKNTEQYSMLLKCQQQKNQNLLDQSLCERQSSFQRNNQKKFSLNTQEQENQQSDRMHITEIAQNRSSLTNQKQKSKLPLIQNKKKEKGLVYLPNLHQVLENSKSNKYYPILRQKCNQNQNLMMKKIKDKNRYCQIQVEQKNNSKKFNLLKQNSKQNSSFEQFFRNNTLPTKYEKSQFGIEKQHIVKSGRIKQYQFDLNMEMKKYKQLIKKQKWRQINQLFQSLEKVSSVFETENIQLNNKQTPNLINNLQQLLMDQLRKKQYFRFQQKGYHEGLKDKTHQIRLEFKKIFKNYSTDQFFDEAMKKKAIKKQLSNILEEYMS